MKKERFNQMEYNSQYQKNNYERVVIIVKKGQKEKIKARAEALNMSTNAYITSLIEKDMEENSDE